MERYEIKLIAYLVISKLSKTQVKMIKRVACPAVGHMPLINKIRGLDNEHASEHKTRNIFVNFNFEES